MSKLFPCPTSFVPVHPKALAFLKDAALIKSGLGKLSLYSLKKIGLTDDECTAVMYIYGIAEAFDFPCAAPTPPAEAAKVEAPINLLKIQEGFIATEHWRMAVCEWLMDEAVRCTSGGRNKIIDKIERRATALAAEEGK